jgi:FtsZ-binding cell division protein ZapB
LSADILSQLENKIDKLISTVKTLREEKDRLSEEMKAQQQKIRESETGSEGLVSECESLKKSNEDKQKKLDSAAEKIQGLLSKLESVA